MITHLSLEPLEPLTDLRNGLFNIRIFGWGQNAYLNKETGCYCAAGALRDHDFSAGVPLLAQAIRESGWEPEFDPLTAPLADWEDASVVIRWNDTDGRTQAEVETMYIAAIQSAKNAQ